MAKKKTTDPDVSGFIPIEVETHVDESWQPIEVTPYVAQPEPTSPEKKTDQPDAGEKKEN